MVAGSMHGLFTWRATGAQFIVNALACFSVVFISASNPFFAFRQCLDSVDWINDTVCGLEITVVEFVGAPRYDIGNSETHLGCVAV